MTPAVAIIAGILLVVAVFYFRANVAKYWRITGYAVRVSALNTLALVVVLAGVIALAWWLSTLCFAPGVWRNMLAMVLYSVLMSVMGTPLIRLLTRLIEVRHHM